MRPTPGDFFSAFLRSFAVQGSWNYRTMIGCGLTYALAPLLQRIHAGDPVALRSAIERHSAEFNANPYMTPIAIGALARLEYEGRDALTMERFRTALRAPLGALGDQLIWGAWRPFTNLLAAIAFLTAGHPLIAAAAFLAVYNVGQVSLRAWGLYRGWQSGLEIGAVLAGLPIRRFSATLVGINQALMAVLLVLLILRVPSVSVEPLVMGATAAVGLAGYLVPERAGGLGLGLLFAASVAWVL